MLITAAVYENDMKEKLKNLKLKTPLQAEKAVVETVEVLKQFGYGAGAEAFQEIVYLAVKENVITHMDM